jgi:hypothetical protein
VAESGERFELIGRGALHEELHHVSSYMNENLIVIDGLTKPMSPSRVFSPHPCITTMSDVPWQCRIGVLSNPGVSLQ